MLKGFQARLLALFLPLLFGVQLATLLVLEDVTRERIAEQSSEALFAVSGSFRNWLDDTVRRLADASVILAADFGFRSAIASADTATIESAVENARRRIGADVALLLDLDGAVVAGSDGIAAGRPFAYPSLLQDAERRGRGASIVSLHDRLMNFVLIPVKAPDLVAWIGIGVEVGERTAEILRGQSAIPVEVTFVVDDSGRWRIPGSTRSGDMPARLDDALIVQQGLCSNAQFSGEPIPLQLDSDHYSMFSTLLATPAGGPHACMVIQRSLDEALSPYQPLFRFLWWLAVAGFLVGAVAAIGIARSVTRPLRELDHAATLVQRGDYPDPIAVNGPTEIAHLATTFNLMVDGIAEREQRIYRQSNFDATTDLPNRSRFEHLLDQAIAEHETVLVFMIQMQNLSEIRNTLGHELGDHVIAHCASRIGNAIHRNDVLCRLDLDKFGLMVRSSGEDASDMVASRIHDVFEFPVTVSDVNVDIVIRIGLARFPEHGDKRRELLRRAEIALDSARHRHLTHEVYDSVRDPYKPERLSMISEMRESMEDGSLKLYYQPKIDAQTGEIAQAEALLRWESPTRGFVPPDEFIELAEHTGFITCLTQWVLERAAFDAGRWRDRGFDLRLSVNVSTRDLLSPRLAESVVAALKRHDLPAKALGVEVTESSLMEQPELALKALEELVALGIEISIDDFGTGHSSMAYVSDMPASELKIDKHFVLDISRNPKSQIIVRTAIQLAHSFGMQVCAEGVEDMAAVEMLQRYGCDFLQGWFYSRAVSADDFDVLLDSWRDRAIAPATASLRSLRA